MQQSDEFGGVREVRPEEGEAVPQPDSMPLESSAEAIRARAIAAAISSAALAAEAEPTVEAEPGSELEIQPGYGPSKLPSGSTCDICGSEQAEIRINVDGNTLLMESCDGCDIRRWQLAGQRIDLQEALNQVGEHSGRRR